MGCDCIFVNVCRPGLWFRNIYEEVLRLLKAGREGFENDSPAIRIEPKRSESMIGFELEFGQVSIGFEQLGCSVIVVLLVVCTAVRGGFEFLLQVYVGLPSAPGHQTFVRQLTVKASRRRWCLAVIVLYITAVGILVVAATHTHWCADTGGDPLRRPAISSCTCFTFRRHH